MKLVVIDYGAGNVASVVNALNQIKEATVNMDYTPVPGAVYNAFRDDTTITTSPESREAILNEAPDREGDFVAVKKIIAQD